MSREYPKWLAEFLPPRGPCALCGDPEARHRMVDAIRARVRAGESVRFVAKDYEMPEPFIRRICARKRMR